MRVVDPGHFYRLDQLDGDRTEVLKFCKRVGPNYPGNGTAYSGTNCQEVLRALIDRMYYLNDQIPCFENKATIWFLKWSVWLFELRHARRKKLPIPTVYEAVYGATGADGHVEGTQM